MSNFFDYAKNALLSVLSSQTQDAFLPTGDGPRFWGKRNEEREAKHAALTILGLALAAEVAALDPGDITHARPGQLDAIVHHLLVHVRTFPERTATEIDRIRTVFLGQYDPISERPIALRWYQVVFSALEQVCLAFNPDIPDFTILEHLVEANTKALLKAYLKRAKQLLKEYQRYQDALLQHAARSQEPLPFLPVAVRSEVPNAIIDLTNMPVDVPDNMQVDQPELSSQSSENDLILWSKMNWH
jgi:hypothetical protein